jgi:hypothetical protein
MAVEQVAELGFLGAPFAEGKLGKGIDQIDILSLELHPLKLSFLLMMHLERSDQIN